jgi:hypothetical protein
VNERHRHSGEHAGDDPPEERVGRFVHPRYSGFQENKL